VDCGTCLGAYRYGGGIPWDHDIDIAVLQPDFENVKNALNKGLDPKKYQVQDWSSRDKPNTYLKVYVKETRALIDIYHCAIDEKKGLIYTIVSNENCIFLPKSWKIRERRCAAAVPISFIFPLKQGYFEDIVVPLPNKPKEYLQSKYGENISPARIYNEKTGQYEKDLSHPYWQLQYPN
jgi:phosphorylcholine metabolism protein LicD